MNLLIQVQDREIVLKLKEGNKTVDKLAWQDENNLSLSFLKNLDKLLRKNNLRIMDLEKSELKIINSGLSTERILSAVSKTVNYCLTK
jgi:hypothetical protein